LILVALGISIVAVALIFGSGDRTARTVVSSLGPRDAAQWPFAADSPWNTPIGRGARFVGAEDPRVADLRDPVAAINAATWSVPVFQAAAHDPVRAVRTPEGTTRFRIPRDATPAAPADGDRHLAVIDSDARWVDECWQASVRHDHWSCRYHVRNSLRGSGVLDGGTRAYGGSSIAGLLRTWELERGDVRHALAFAVPRADLEHGPIWPASSEDEGAVYRGNLRMGTLVAIPPSVDLGSLGLSAPGLAIARALQTYGAYLVDASENFTLYAEPSAEDLLGPAREDLDRIRRLLRVVDNNDATHVGGGGERTGPAAPPFG
jgi:hypothetical protein